MGASEGYATVLAGILIFLGIEYRFHEVRLKEVWLKRIEDALTIVVITLIIIAISLLTFEINDGSRIVFVIGLIILIVRTVVHLDLRRTDVTFT